MATITTDLICNLNQPVAATFLHGNLFSQDNAGNTINVHVMDNGEPATIGGTVSANVIRADGNTVAVSGAIDGNKAYVILPQACYAVPGRVEIIIKLTQNTTITTIAAIVANVYRSTTDTVVDPGTIIPSIQTLIAEIEEAVDSIPVDYSGLLHTIAAEYSSSKTYPVVGMYAWQGGVLKRNIVPITTAETYTAAHWTNAVIGDDLSALKSAVNNISKYAKTTVFDWQEGYRIATNTYVIDLSAVYPSPNYSCQIIEVSKGDTFKLTAHASNSIYNAYCFTDINKNNKKISGAGTFQNYEIVAPVSGYLIVCTDNRTYQGLIMEEALSSLVADNQQNKEEIAELDYKIKNTETILFPESFFEQGTFGTNGSEADSNYAIRLKEKILTTRTVALEPHEGYRVLVVKYSKDGIYESQTGWVSTTQTVPADKQFRFAISHTTPTQETALTDYDKVLTVGSSYDEYLLHNTIKDENDHAWAIREGLFIYNADIFGTGNNDHGELYYVGPNETYTTINGALTAWAADNYPDATIFIRNGEYNETVEVEGKTIRFIGESRDGTIIHTTTGNYVNPPFNVRHGTVTLKNMTLIADHSENPDFDYEAQPTLKAYGIHIDGGNVGGIVTVENCTIMSFQAPAVGSGTIPNSKIRLIDCDCYCFTDYTSDQSSAQFDKLALGCILWHTSNPTIYPVRGTEEFELINVRAYMKNYYVVLKTEKSDSGDTMDMLAINTLLVTDRNPYDQNPVSGPVNPVEGAIGNNNNKLNYHAQG